MKSQAYSRETFGYDFPERNHLLFRLFKETIGRISQSHSPGQHWPTGTWWEPQEETADCKKRPYISKINFSMLLYLTQYDPSIFCPGVSVQQQLYQITTSSVNLENNLFSLSTKGSGGQSLKSVPLGTNWGLAGPCVLLKFLWQDPVSPLPTSGGCWQFLFGGCTARVSASRARLSSFSSACAQVFLFLTHSDCLQGLMQKFSTFFMCCKGEPAVCPG